MVNYRFRKITKLRSGDIYAYSDCENCVKTITFGSSINFGFLLWFFYIVFRRLSGSFLYVYDSQLHISHRKYSDEDNSRYLD